jgi:hypothetical protein
MEEQNKKLIAQMQMMQQRIEQLEREVKTTVARPSAGASAAAASSPLPASAAAFCTLRQQSSSSPPTQLSSAHRLHKDALHCVLAFLSLMELPFGMRFCRAWYAAVRSLPLRDASFPISTRQLYLLPFSASTPLARHIVTCDVRRMCTAYDLAQLLNCLPNLTALTHWLCRSTELHPQLYSSQLRELNLHLNPDSDDVTDAVIAQMENLSSAKGLHRLTVTLPYISGGDRRVSLASIECMKELESLTLINGHFLPQAKLVPLRRLPSLRTLSLGGWSPSQMLALLEDRPDCPPLQLHAFEGIYDLNLETAQLLICMPTLQRVEPERIRPNALHLVAHGLPDLRTLRIDARSRWGDETDVVDWRMIRESLAACRQLASLTLQSPPLEELIALLPVLAPSVRKIDIHCESVLQSDAFFQCVAEGGLRQLHQLRIRHSGGDRYEAREVAAWRARMADCAPWINAMVDA